VHVRSTNGVYGWSLDGRVLVATEDSGTNSSRALALSPKGHVLWRVKNGGIGSGTWSAHGLLALNTGRSSAGARQAIAVYDEAGHLRFKVPFGRLNPARTWSPSATWSPDGSRLALVSGRAFQVRTTAGRVLLRKRVSRLSDLNLLWDGNCRTVIAGYGACHCHAKSVDIRTGKTSPASNRFARHQTSPDGRLAILEAPAGDEFEIQVAPTAGGPARAYAHVPACDDEAGVRYADFGSAQFLPGNRSIVYASICSTPASSLYSVSAAGGPAHRITASRSPYWSPALSPDGSKIAYVTNRCAGLGCGSPTSSIAVLNTDGSGERVLATPARSSSKCLGDYTESPSWSPDGATILFGLDTCNRGTALPQLYTVPASGGAAHDLGVRAFAATWGPSRIAYVGLAPPGEPAGTFIWTAKPDGTDPVPVHGSSAGDSPAWSPSGQLAYLRNNHRTVVVGTSQATFPFARVVALALSPDGTRLVVTAQETPTAPVDVYTVSPSGAAPIRLTQNYDAGGVSWR
jgi:Tol biopolymer transport system component